MTQKSADVIYFSAETWSQFGHVQFSVTAGLTFGKIWVGQSWCCGECIYGEINDATSSLLCKDINNKTHSLRTFECVCMLCVVLVSLTNIKQNARMNNFKMLLSSLLNTKGLKWFMHYVTCNITMLQLQCSAAQCRRAEHSWRGSESNASYCRGTAHSLCCRYWQLLSDVTGRVKVAEITSELIIAY